MIRLSRRYTFFAAHRLHSPVLSAEENRQTYGKCNNPHGHGHNYDVQVTIAGQVDAVTGRVIDIGRLDELMRAHILPAFRYRNLNEEVPEFRKVVPTTENLGIVLDRRIRSAWTARFGENGPRLETIRIWETERNICEIAADSEAQNNQPMGATPAKK